MPHLSAFQGPVARQLRADGDNARSAVDTLHGEGHSRQVWSGSLMSDSASDSTLHMWQTGSQAKGLLVPTEP